MACPQLRAISVSLAGSEPLRAAKSHFDRLQCLSRATSQPSRAVTSLHGLSGFCMYHLSLRRFLPKKQNQSEFMFRPNSQFKLWRINVYKCRGGNITEHDDVQSGIGTSALDKQLLPAVKIVDTRQYWFRYPLLLTSFIMSRHCAEPILRPCAPGSTATQIWRRSLSS